MKRKDFFRTCVFCTMILFTLVNSSIANVLSNPKSKQASSPIKVTSIASGFTNPVFVANARDNRLFIVEQNGRVRVYQNNALVTAPFLDITTLVNFSGERGLYCLTFHPQYPTVPFFYVHFASNGTTLPDGTTPASGNNIIARFSVSSTDPNVADLSSEKTLLVIPQANTNHNGGMLEFGKDGFLYIAKGDGGGANDPGRNAQNTQNLLGKILRLDVDQNVNVAPYHGIPAGNPFINATNGERKEIFLFGLRNPWRFSFDRANGDLWIGDVGQGLFEEIDRFANTNNVIQGGGNLGWRVYEGTNCTNLEPGFCTPANYVAPTAQYDHSNGRCSITGGYVYRGSSIPALQGRYIYADFCTGEIFSLQGTTQTVLLDAGFNILSFGEDVNGELLVTGANGNVYRVQNTVATAASVSLSGRVTNSNGRGVKNVLMTLTSGDSSAPRFARTNSFGYYNFTNVGAGQNYTITPSSKRYGFEPNEQFLSVSGEETQINFNAQSSR